MHCPFPRCNYFVHLAVLWSKSTTAISDGASSNSVCQLLDVIYLEKRSKLWGIYFSSNFPCAHLTSTSSLSWWKQSMFLCLIADFRIKQLFNLPSLLMVLRAYLYLVFPNMQWLGQPCVSNQVCALHTRINSPDGGLPGLHKRTWKAPGGLLAWCPPGIGTLLGTVSSGQKNHPAALTRKKPWQVLGQCSCRENIRSYLALWTKYCPEFICNTMITCCIRYWISAPEYVFDKHTYTCQTSGFQGVHLHLHPDGALPPCRTHFECLVSNCSVGQLN